MTITNLLEQSYSTYNQRLCALQEKLANTPHNKDTVSEVELLNNCIERVESIIADIRTAIRVIDAET